MFLRKETGGTSIGPHEWPEDGSITEVPDELGRSLMAIPDSGFEKVDGPAPEAAETPEAGGDAKPGDPVTDPEASDPAVTEPETDPVKRPGRKPAAQK